MLRPEQTRALTATRFADVRFLDVVDSTNEMLLDLARAGAGEGLVLVADQQTAGRGRLGRRWDASPGASLLVSVLLRPELPVEHAPLVTVAAGVAAAEACLAAAGVRCSLKWPNDLIAATPEGDRKLAGILTESVLEGSDLVAVVVGMGLNVRGAGLAPELAAIATALDLLGSGAAREELLVAWLIELDRCYDRLVGGDHAGLVDSYRRHCSTIGRRVRAELAGDPIEGMATGITAEGHLEIDTADGRRTVVAGDVVHLRLAAT